MLLKSTFLWKNKSRTIAAGIAFLLSAFGMSILLLQTKGCVDRNPGAELRLLACFGATHGDLGLVDYLIMVTVGAITMTVVWFVFGKLAAWRHRHSKRRPYQIR